MTRSVSTTFVPSDGMVEGIHGHRARELAVDPMQEVKIECPRYNRRSAFLDG